MRRRNQSMSKDKYGTMSEQLPTETEPYAKAPRVTESVYLETNPLLVLSDLVYFFAVVLDKVKKKELALDIPEIFNPKVWSRFLTESADLTEFNDGDGLCLFDMNALIHHNGEVLIEAFPSEYPLVVEWSEMLKEFVDDYGNDNKKIFFLSHFRAIQRNVSCVYSVIKDKFNKKIIVSFRGSTGFLFTTRDWQTNFNFFPARMNTPNMIKHKMEGRLKKEVLVNSGFYKYLFDNNKKDGDQRYDMIIKDVEKAIGGEEGYSVYITGHSLGGSLATMLSFKLAGASKCCHNIPRPITCITFAAPSSGWNGYGTAFEHLEREGLLRSLRLNNREDIVPTIFGVFFLKHVGINLRLSKSGSILEHASRANIWTAFRNTILKPICRLRHWHSLPLMKRRLDNNQEALEAVTLDELYKNETIVSKGFIDG